MAIKLLFSILSTALIFISGIQASHAGCIRIGATACQLLETVDPKTVVRVGGFIKHKGSYSNDIRLLCPVNASGIKKQHISKMYLYVVDGTVPAPDLIDPRIPSRVTAKLKYINRDAKIAPIMEIDTYDHSERPFLIEKSATSKSMTFDVINTINGKFNHVGGFYYVDVTIKRPDPSKRSAAFAGVAFCGATE